MDTLSGSMDHLTEASLNTEPELISIQGQVLSKDSRYRVSHNNQRQWILQVKQIKSTDRGELF